MPTLFWDIETRSTVPLEDAGAWRYAADPSTEILCVGYAVDDFAVKIWTPGQAIPQEFIAAASDPSWCIVAHNFAFERAIATRLLQPRFNWPEIPLAQQRCSMSLALANALPPALDNAARALKLDYQKDSEGYLLMRRMSRPRRPRKGEDPNGVYWVDGPERASACISIASVTSKQSARFTAGCRHCRRSNSTCGRSTQTSMHVASIPMSP